MTFGNEPTNEGRDLPAPKGATLNCGEQLWRRRKEDRLSHQTTKPPTLWRERQREAEGLLTDVLKDVDDEERRDQVVDALHVAAGRVADGPNEEDAFKNLTTPPHPQKRSIVLEKWIYFTVALSGFKASVNQQAGAQTHSIQCSSSCKSVDCGEK